jgi:hypothetical protein
VRRDRWLEDRLGQRETRVRLSLLLLAVRVLTVIILILGGALFILYLL